MYMYVYMYIGLLLENWYLKRHRSLLWFARNRNVNRQILVLHVQCIFPFGLINRNSLEGFSNSKLFILNITTLRVGVRNVFSFETSCVAVLDTHITSESSRRRSNFLPTVQTSIFQKQTYCRVTSHRHILFLHISILGYMRVSVYLE